MAELHIERRRDHYAVQLREGAEDTAPAEVTAPVDWRHAPDWTIERRALAALAEEVLRLRDDAIKSCNEITQMRGDLMRLELQSRIKSFRTYHNNWDGAGAVSPSVDAIYIAVSFVKCLPNGVARPHISLAADGEIHIGWTLPQFKFSVSAWPDGTLSYYGKHEDGREFVCERMLSTDPLPDDVLALLMERGDQ